MKGNQHLLGFHHSIKTRLKMSESHKNPSLEIRQKISEGGKGRIVSNETRRKLSEWHKGFKHSIETKEKIRELKKGENNPLYGTHRSVETRRKIGKAQIGELHYNWQGGLNSLNMVIRKCFDYRQWRSDVFARDNYTCQMCWERGTRLHAHHIISVSSLIQYYEITKLEEALECDELWNINNGITYCEECHKKIHKKLIKSGDIQNVSHNR